MKFYKIKKLINYAKLLINCFAKNRNIKQKLSKIS